MNGEADLHRAAMNGISITMEFADHDESMVFEPTLCIPTNVDAFSAKTHVDGFAADIDSSNAHAPRDLKLEARMLAASGLAMAMVTTTTTTTNGSTAGWPLVRSGSQSLNLSAGRSVGRRTGFAL